MNGAGNKHLRAMKNHRLRLLYHWIKKAKQVFFIIFHLKTSAKILLFEDHYPTFSLKILQDVKFLSNFAA